MKKLSITQLRTCFWSSFPEFRKYFTKGKRQNDYPCDVRCAWVAFVDMMYRDNQISNKTAQKAIL